MPDTLTSVKPVDVTRQAEQLEAHSVSEAMYYKPARIYEIELAKTLPTLSAINDQTGLRYQSAWCLIRLHSQPLGMIELNFSGDSVEPDQYSQQIWHALHRQINDHLQQDDLPTIAGISPAGLSSLSTPACIVRREQFVVHAPFVSVVVPTRNRPDRLALCLRSLLNLRYPAYEIIVVDNAPTTAETADVVQEMQKSAPFLFYLREDRPGISWARNKGIAIARGEIIAFTDDDVVVDSYWLTELIYAFTLSTDVTCTTGAILPLELETPAQLLFERYGAFPRTFKRRIFNMQEHHPKTPLFPFVAGIFGAGASTAFTASCIRNLGGFDPALGGNRLGMNGQDLDLLFRVVMQGHTLVYTPSALLYHQHRRDFVSLRKQICNYGAGFVAFLTKNICLRPSLLLRLTVNIPRGLFRLLKARTSRRDDPLTRSIRFPKDLMRLELKGMLYGPLAYFKACYSVRKMYKKRLNC